MDLGLCGKCHRPVLPFDRSCRHCGVGFRDSKYVDSREFAELSSRPEKEERAYKRARAREARRQFIHDIYSRLLRFISRIVFIPFRPLRHIYEAVAEVLARKTFKAVGLQWQATPAYRMPWQDAKTYAAQLSLSGGGWRLPTKGELSALRGATDESSQLRKLLGDMSYSYGEPNLNYYWSSSPPRSERPDYMDCVDMHTGWVGSKGIDEHFLVRCVRWRHPIYEAVAKALARKTFKAVGMQWQATPAYRMPWQDAKTYAAQLSLSGGGWRLPTEDQLIALHRAKDESLQLQKLFHMPYESSGYSCYWSSSPPLIGSNCMKYVDFDPVEEDLYSARDRSMGALLLVRCVREK